MIPLILKFDLSSQSNCFHLRQNRKNIFACILFIYARNEKNKFLSRFGLHLRMFKVQQRAFIDFSFGTSHHDYAINYADGESAEISINFTDFPQEITFSSEFLIKFLNRFTIFFYHPLFLWSFSSGRISKISWATRESSFAWFGNLVS